MSAEALSFAWDNLKTVKRAAAKTMLLRLGDQANADGWCYTSYAEMGRALGISIRSLGRAAKELEDAGFIQRFACYDSKGSQRPSIFVVCVNGPLTVEQLNELINI